MTENGVKESKGESKCMQWMTGIHAKAYTSRALTSWGDRMWHFALGLFMVRLAGNSLRLAAVFGFLSSSSVIIFGGPIGGWVDRTPRLKAARTALVIQNFSVTLCSLVFCLVVHFEDYFRSTWEGLFVIGQVVVILIALVSRLSSVASTLIVEKDWIIEIAGRDPKKLATLNATFRRIDLTSLVTAPVAVGQIMTYTSMIASAIFLAAWNIFSVFVEFWLLWLIYKITPALQVPKQLDEGHTNLAMDQIEPQTQNGDKANGTKASEASDVVVQVPSETKEKKSFFGIKRQLSEYAYAWKLYFQQDVLFAGFSLAFLFMTVLGFDSITVGYAFIQGVSESFMGWMSGLSAIFGIAGTLAYPYLRKKFGLLKSGLFGLSCLVLALTPCVVSIWIPGSPYDPYFTRDAVSVNQTSPSSTSTADFRYESIGLFIAGVIIARFGLWISDLTITQLFQENVQDINRGKVGGVQKSLEEGMNLLKFILVIAAPRIETFGILIILSFLFICFGFISFTIYARHLCCPLKEEQTKSDQEISDNREKGTESTGYSNPAATIDE